MQIKIKYNQFKKLAMISVQRLKNLKENKMKQYNYSKKKIFQKMTWLKSYKN